MNQPFDPYHQWLGIRDPQRPPNWYRLLGIDLFESDVEVIETAADRQMAHLRTYQNGPHGEVSQRLLNEVAAAKVGLLDAARKALYDEQLRQQLPRPSTSTIAGELANDESPVDPSTVHVRAQHVALRPPGRGPRAERPWYVSMLFLLPLLGIVACLAVYRIYRDHFRSLGPIAESSVEAPLENPVLRQGEETAREDEADDEADDEAAGEATGESAPPEDADAPGADEAPSEAPSPVVPKTSEASQATDTSDDGESAPAETEDSRGGEQAVADGAPVRTRPAPPSARGSTAKDPAQADVSGPPPRFTTREPLGPFLLSLSQRDFTAADSALQALRVHRAAGIPPDRFQQADLVRESLSQFWSAVDASIESLSVDDSLMLDRHRAVVAQKDAASLTLKLPDGKQQEFPLARDKMDRDLAVALVRHHYAASPPIAWRLISTFLAVDYQGDVARAVYWAQLAERQGFAAEFLTEIIRSLSGDGYAPSAEAVNDSAGSPVTAPVAREEPQTIGDAPSSTAALPDLSDQQSARREVLAPLLSDLQKQDVPANDWARHLLQHAGSDQLDPAARYVLLDSALKRARSRRDVDTALAAIDVLARDFAQSRADLRYELLQSISRRLRGEDRRRYAELAHEMARDAVRENDYDEAIRFASLAQSLGRSLADQSFRRYLLDFRLEIDAIREAHEALTASESRRDGTSAPDPARQARFQILAQGDFQGDWNALLEAEDSMLRGVVERELARPQQAAPQLELARAWIQLSEQLAGVEKVNALRRAQHWLDTCVPKLNRAQRKEARRDLDAIARVVGRKSDRLDLTAEPVLAATVGFGTFGVNQNPDAAVNAKIQPLPKIDGAPVRRFLWVCPPSRVEYLVPAGAHRFTAIGLVNAATQDGVRFVVKADGQELASEVLTQMGQSCPIEVALPSDTETLELIVEPQKSIVLDHTYWINPELVF